MSANWFIIFFPLISLTAVYGQLKFVDLSYSPFDKGPPNAGYLQAYLSGDTGGWPGETPWYPVCATTTGQARLSLSLYACMKYGYDKGTISEISYNNPQNPCVDFSCPSSSPNLAECSVTLDRQWREKKILNVVCYKSNIFPLAQKSPQDRNSYSINCDFEGGNSCGWELYYMQVTPAGVYYQTDATLGTSDGFLLAQTCSTEAPWGIPPYQTVFETRATTFPLDHCLGYAHYCFVFSALAPLSSSVAFVSMNISVVNVQGAETWSTVWNSDRRGMWATYQIGFTAAPPFRLKIRSNCPGREAQPPLLFLDDFLLTTGDCPLYRNSYCFNGGKEAESKARDRYCVCPNGWTMGRQCELTACNQTNSLSTSAVGYVMLMLAFQLLFAQ